MFKVSESPAGAVELPPLPPPAGSDGLLYPPEVAGAGVGAGVSLYPPAVIVAEVALPGGTGGLPLPSPPADANADAGVGAPSAGGSGAASVVDLALAVIANALAGCAVIANALAGCAVWRPSPIA